MRDYALLDETVKRLGCPALRDEPMAKHTSFRIGGPADRMLFPEDEAQLKALLAAVDPPVLILGNGSNLLVADKGIRGVVLVLSGSFRKAALLPEGVTLRAGAGLSLASLCVFARDRALSGLEFAWGIPGTLGGGVCMNAGAYGGELKDVITRVTALSPEGERREYGPEELGFGYRKSRFSDSRELVLSAELLLERGDAAQIAGKMEELMNRRREKQPTDLPSAGSVFKRPEGAYAGALIEQCGLKGARVGGAQVSPKHAGFIVNNGGASCADVLALIEKIQEEVLRQTGFVLEREVRLAGEF